MLVHKRSIVFVFFCNFLVCTISLDPSKPFPSCLVNEVTWDPHYVIDLVQEVPTPELCQVACSDNADCAGFSWISEDIDLLVAHSCVLFSQTEEEIPHENIVSGPSSCPCTITGGCVDQNHNILDVLPNIETGDECTTLCAKNESCEVFTYVGGEGHIFSHLCFLYSSCSEFDPDCTECITGVPDCEHCSFAETHGDQCDVVECAKNADLISIAPPLDGYSSRMVLCDDPLDQTCEEDIETLCPQGFHLCTYQEFITLNDGWKVTIAQEQRPVGEIYCRKHSGAGHFALGYENKPDMIPLDFDASRNCYFGSSRPQCPSNNGCDEKFVTALCCSPSPTCGDGVVDEPLEECDDGNNSDEDDCLSTCTLRKPGSGC